MARSVRGIEWVLAAEVENAIGGKILSIGHREVQFVSACAPQASELSGLRTADDVFLRVGDADDVNRSRASLNTIRRSSQGLSWSDALATLRQIRPSARWTSFTVTASFLGKRNYNRYEIEEEVASAVNAALGLRFRPSLESPVGTSELAVRVHLVEDRASFGIRVFDIPLHRRPYKVRSHPGTLHPPLASAMALLAGLHPDSQILDPFSGVGTIAIEAKFVQPSAMAVASDINRERLRDASINAAAAQVTVEFVEADAGQLPLADHCVDRIVTNTPWQIAVEAKGRFADTPRLSRYTDLARVLKRNGRAALLVHSDDTQAMNALNSAGLDVGLRFQVSVSGQHPWLYILTPAVAGVVPAIDVGAPLGELLSRHLHHVHSDRFHAQETARH